MQFRNRRTRIATVAAAALGAGALAFSLAGQAGAFTGDSAPGAGKNFPRGTVQAEGGLSARSAPSTHAQKTYDYEDGATISINCHTGGTLVDGQRTWYLVSAEGDAKWVSARYVEAEGETEFCGSELSVSGTTNTDARAAEGPTGKDRTLRTHKEGTGVEITCYTNTGPDPEKDRWMLTTEVEWIHAPSLDTREAVPFCEQM